MLNFEVLQELFLTFLTKMCTKRLVNICAKFWENILADLWTSRQIDTTQTKVCISEPGLKKQSSGGVLRKRGS